MKELCIAHSVTNWLPLTMPWIYNQVKYLQDTKSIVLADQVQHLDTFPHLPIVTSNILKNEGIYTIIRGIRRLGIRWNPVIYDDAIKLYKPQVLHSHFGDRGWYDLPLKGRYLMKQVVTFYGYDLNWLPTRLPVWQKRYQELFKLADLFLCEGAHMAQMLTRLGCPQEKIKIHRIGIELDRIPFVPRSIGEDGLIKILIAGSFREKKGIPYALEAIGRIRNSHDKVLVTVIGDAGGQKREQSEKMKILKTIERYHLGTVTRMLGYQPYDTLLKEMYNHHIFLSPSITASDGDTEGGAPVTIIEAAGSGMPVVSTIHCDIPNIIQNESSGLLLPERNVIGLSESISRLILHPELITSMGRAGRAFVETHHDIRRQAGEMRRFYTDI